MLPDQQTMCGHGGIRTSQKIFAFCMIGLINKGMAPFLSINTSVCHQVVFYLIFCTSLCLYIDIGTDAVNIHRPRTRFHPCGLPTLFEEIAI